MDAELVRQFHETIKKQKKTVKRDMFDGQLYRSEFFMLVAVEEWCEANGSEGIKPSRLAESCGLSMSAASKQIKSVEDKGYIERSYCRTDKRVVYLKLSEKGKKLLDMAKCDRNKDVINLIEKLGEEKIRQYISLSNEIHEILCCEKEEK